MHQDKYSGAAFGRARYLDDIVATRPVLVLLGLLCLAALMLWPYRHFSGDDAYITFRFARNLATGHGYAFNPGVPVYGSTAPLWVMLIAAVSYLGLDFPNAAHLLNWVFLASNVVLMFHLARAFLGRSGGVIVASALMIADPWFIRWSLSGMENGLALCLLMSLLLSQRKFRNSGHINFISPIAAALAGLCRPEMCLLSGLLMIDIFLFERRRRLQNCLTTAVVCAAVFIPWLAYAYDHFGSIVPTTILAKVSSMRGAALLHVLQYFLTFWLFQACAVAVAAYMILKDTISMKFDRAAASEWFLVCAWAALLPAFYIIGGAPVAGRYMVFGLPCYLIIGVKAWMLTAPRFPRLVAASILGSFALVAVVQYKYCWYITRWPQGMDPKMITIADTLKAASAPSDVVACDQIGVIGYFSDRYVLDQYGLASPEILPIRKLNSDAAVWRYVHERHPEFLFATYTIDELARLDSGYRSLTLITKEDVQREGSAAVGALITYYLYRTNWTAQTSGSQVPRDAVTAVHSGAAIPTRIDMVRPINEVAN